mgnify:CR=1 FL=1
MECVTNNGAYNGPDNGGNKECDLMLTFPLERVHFAERGGFAPLGFFGSGGVFSSRFSSSSPRLVASLF